MSPHRLDILADQEPLHVSPPILLHIASTAGQVTTVDRSFWGTALVIASIGIWLPRSPLPLSSLAGAGAAASRAATAALVFLALRPPSSRTTTCRSRLHSEEADASVHVSHCHVSPGTAPTRRSPLDRANSSSARR